MKLHLWRSRCFSSPCPGDWGALLAGAGRQDNNAWTPSLAIWASTLLTTQNTGWVRDHSYSSPVWVKTAAVLGARESTGRRGGPPAAVSAWGSDPHLHHPLWQASPWWLEMFCGVWLGAGKAVALILQLSQCSDDSENFIWTLEISKCCWLLCFNIQCPFPLLLLLPACAPMCPVQKLCCPWLTNLTHPCKCVISMWPWAFLPYKFDHARTLYKPAERILIPFWFGFDATQLLQWCLSYIRDRHRVCLASWFLFTIWHHDFTPIC